MEVQLQCIGDKPNEYISSKGKQVKEHVAILVDVPGGDSILEHTVDFRLEERDYGWKGKLTGRVLKLGVERTVTIGGQAKWDGKLLAVLDRPNGKPLTVTHAGEVVPLSGEARK